jgi:predicted TIM-barrel fold metal-dependent hydrolase
MIIDAHAHIGATTHQKSPPSLGVMYDVADGPALVALMDETGIDKAVVFPAHTVGPDLDENYERGNKRVADAVSAFPDRLIGFARVDPRYGRRASDELKRCVDDYGVRGLKLHPNWECFRPSNLRLLSPLLERLSDLKFPLLIYVGYELTAEPTQSLVLAKAFPDVPVMLSHLGFRLATDSLIIAKEAANIYLEVSGVGSGVVNRAIKQVGSDRVIFGSDVPYSIPRWEIEKIRLLPEISEEDKTRVLGGNLSHLLRLNTDQN